MFIAWRQRRRRGNCRPGKSCTAACACIINCMTNGWKAGRPESEQDGEFAKVHASAGVSDAFAPHYIVYVPTHSATGETVDRRSQSFGVGVGVGDGDVKRQRPRSPSWRCACDRERVSECIYSSIVCLECMYVGFGLAGRQGMMRPRDTRVHIIMYVCMYINVRIIGVVRRTQWGNNLTQARTHALHTHSHKGVDAERSDGRAGVLRSGRAHTHKHAHAHQPHTHDDTTIDRR